MYRVKGEELITSPKAAHTTKEDTTEEDTAGDTAGSHCWWTWTPDMMVLTRRSEDRK